MYNRECNLLACSDCDYVHTQGGTAIDRTLSHLQECRCCTFRWSSARVPSEKILDRGPLSPEDCWQV